MNAPEASDDDLMTSYAGGDSAAFTRLYDRYRGPTYRYFLRQLPADQADDCFQALWLRVIDQAPRFRPSGAFSGWLFTLAHNLLMDHYRQRGRLREVDDGNDSVRESLPDPATDGTVDGAGFELPEAAAVRQELRARLLALLERLPFHQREAWVLKQESALTVEEVAAVTGTSIEGVRSRLRYATRKLKSGMARYV